MPAIYLIRHGKASPEADDYDELSVTGFEQARLLGAELKRRDLRVGPVVSGGLRRQRQTATAALAEADLTAEPATDERWNEYEHLGLLQQQGVAEGSLQERLDAALNAWTSSGDTGAGSWLEFRAGAQAALADVAAGLQRGQTALVFTSAGVIAAVLAALLQAPTPGFLALNRTVVNASMSKVVHGRGGIQPLSFNDHAHLEQGGPALVTYR